MRCAGKTQSDKQCKRNAESKSKYCYQHKDQQELFLDGLPRSITELPRKAQTKMLKGPTKKDGKGHIYVYRLLRDEREAESYWKIGRTTQTVEKRLSQWSNSILKQSYTVKYNKLAEHLIHIILDQQRIYRYQYKVGKRKDAVRFHSVYKRTGEPVMDTQNRQLEIEAGDWTHKASKKHIEWFICDWKYARKVIAAVILYVNQLK